jgi:predicted phosphodiesterase
MAIMGLRVRILSDLHLECAPWTYVHAPADLIVLAGDIADCSAAGRGRRRELLEAIGATGVPAVYVPGNHEGYDDWVPRNILRTRIASELPPTVHLLDRDESIVQGYRILGCTLWTDFAHVAGIRRRGIPIDREYAMHAAGCGITDFHFLCDDGAPDAPPRRITPEIMAAWHAADRNWLDTTIAASTQPTIVVTHFLPGPGSVAPQYQDSILTPYFAPDVRDLLRHPVQVWIHGHTHVPCDYRHGAVRVVCNPRGYASTDSGYDGMLVIDA